MTDVARQSVESTQVCVDANRALIVARDVDVVRKHFACVFSHRPFESFLGAVRPNPRTSYALGAGQRYRSKPSICR